MSEANQIARMRSQGILALMFIAFIPLTFSEEILEALFERFGQERPWWVLVTTDSVLLLLVFFAAWSTKRGRVKRGWRVRFWWYISGALITIALDVFTELTQDWRHLLIDMLSVILYTFSLALLIAASVGASPLGLISRRIRERNRIAWARFRMAIPLIIGTFAAYSTSVLWDWSLAPGVIRTFQQAADHAGGAFSPTDPGTYMVLESLCSGAVDQEYFAQISQLIVLLLIAVGLEAKFYQGAVRFGAQRAMVITTVVILCMGEVFALSALPLSNQGCSETMDEWHEYLAFIITAEACCTALATLAWTLVLGRNDSDDGLDNSERPNPALAVSEAGASSSVRIIAPRKEMESGQSSLMYRVAAFLVAALIGQRIICRFRAKKTDSPAESP